ncbi:RT0821/Lpp0805 family surface protein [Corticibacterium sp. UT-5YL-CI-8]|nr:RT0821/Lpp0805 family surface protein [Tianweitania sp. UT-5YL-CI-8]
MTAVRIKIVVAFALLALAGCSTTSGVVGALTPGAESAENNVSASIIRSLNGGLIGGQIGSGLSDSDRRSALAAEYRALEYAQASQLVTWSGSSGRTGQVVALQPYRVGSQDCRQYTQTVNSTAAVSTARGTACRNPDGSWSLLN